MPSTAGGRSPSIGQPLPRFEDRRLLAGQGRYTDDISVAGQVWALMLRSPHAHAILHRIDVARALAAPGALAVLTGADYQRDGGLGIAHVPNSGDAIEPAKPAFRRPETSVVVDKPQWPLAIDRVRHVGEGIAFVVAKTLEQARDAAERITVDYEALPAVVAPLDALAEDAPGVWDDVPRNLALQARFGGGPALERAFAEAAVVVEHEFVNQRIVNAQMEPRSAIGQYDATTGMHTLVSGSQGVVRQKAALMAALRLPEDKVRVVSPDVGGGFGPRTMLYPEALLAVWAARRLGRPVKWTSDRSEAFVSDYQGRDVVTRAALALTAEGRVLALRMEMFGNIGAHTVTYVPLANGYRVVPSIYDIPHVEVSLNGVFTHTPPTAPYRGAGRPETIFVIERLLDMAAARLRLDRAEIRRRNLISRMALPYRSAVGLTYECGDFAGNMRRALEMGDWAGFASRRMAAAERGRLRGIGVANYVEAPVGAPREQVVVTVAPEGHVDVVTGTQSTGQGHETSFAQVIGDRLGVAPEAVRLRSGDTDFVKVGGGTHSDRSLRLAGTLLARAGDKILARARAVAARRLGADAAQVEYADGLFRASTSNEALTLFDITRVERLSALAEINERIPAHPTGCAVCEVEIDPETGDVTLVRYVSVDDVGQIVNPLIVHGQVHGGIVQGAGQALSEHFVVECGTGQVYTGSFLDYALPRADRFPPFEVATTEDPTGGNPLRVKGGGESGITPATAAIINAVVDALAPYGIEHVDMPATPMRVWSAINAHKSPGRHV